MTIPAITAYPMPAADEIPPGALHWICHPDRAALLVHDMQRYFIDYFPAASSPVRELIGNVRLLLAAARAAGMPVIYTAQPGAMTAEERGLLADVWGPGMGADEADRQIAPEVAPGPADTVLTKWRYSAFARSPLDELLARQGRDQLVICGVYAHVGCLMTACDAFARDIQPFLVADAIADFNADYHRLALRYAGERCAATPTTDALIGQLASVART